jgi:hypothetical protein
MADGTEISKVRIVGGGVEGGGVTVYGRRVGGGDTDARATWIFWWESSAMYLDDNDDEAWSSARSEEFSDLEAACPKDLFRLYPTGVHPEFASWFRRALDEKKRALEASPDKDEEFGPAKRRKRIQQEWERVIAEAEAEKSEEEPDYQRRAAEEMMTLIASTQTKTQIGDLTEKEYAALVEACSALPPAEGNYHITDYVENLLLTVIDFQMNTKAVIKAMQYFKSHTQKDAPDVAGLKAVLAQYPDDKVGNTDLAQRLWGYNLWTRAEMLRRLVAFFESEDVTDQAGLERWAKAALFKTHFEGKVKGLGYAVFNWLIIRQGVESIKPDVHVLRFAAEAVGRPVKETVAVEALVRAAKDLGMPVHKLDWAIWEAGRGGSV